MSPNDTYPQHVVTAVIVAHDGAAWLPHVIDGLLEQTRPVQRVVAADTGSRDRSGSVLAAKLGQGVVFGMDRSTGYGAAVARALEHKAANTVMPGRPAQYREGSGADERVEWIWLLHDDCEPAADALEQLLRGAAETPNAAVLGPKVMDWSDRDIILEAGVTIDTAGRRITGIEPREVDQGQHDGDRDTLAVSSPGMLVRRDVWDQTRGFDTSMGLLREDVDFCWRVHAAGYRVRVITDAVVFHAQAMARRRRDVSVGRRSQLLDRRNALLTLAGNLPLRPMLRSLAGNTVVSLLRAMFFLVAKRVTAAVDETAALASVLGHPLRLLRVRKARARGRRAAYGRLRADLPPGRSFRRVAEFIAAMSGSAQQDTAGSHHATEDPAEDDFLLTDSGLAQRILTSPSVLLLLGLLIVTGIAERSLLRAGTLGGGALLPAADGAAGLWREYLQGFHPTGIGSSTIMPPYVAVMAILATVLLGKAWLAVDVVLLGSVPIAGMAAYLAVRRVTTAAPVRVWAAAAYAFVPVAMGVIAAGRLGTAAAFAVIPLIGLLAGRMVSQPPRIARRAAWATGLAIALGAAFVPLLWPIALLGAVLAGLALRHRGPAILRNLAIVVVVPPVLLIPWTLQLVTHPGQLLLEVGVPQAGLASPGLAARSILLLSPGGPGLPPVWVTAGLLLAALAALAATRRRVLVLAGWTVAVLGLLIAALVSQISVRPAAGGPAITAWPGAVLAIAAAGLLLAAAAGGDSLGAVLSRGRTGLRRAASGRGLAVAALAIVACSAPVLAAGLWLARGVSGPIGPDSGQVVPALVTAAGDQGAQPRTLVLSSAGAGMTYTLLRGNGLSLGDGDLAPAPAATRALSTVVASLVAPAGGQAINQAQVLAHFDVAFVLLRAPVNQALTRTLDAVPGLRPVSATATFALWRLTATPSRVAVVEASGAVVPVPSGQVGVSGAAAPAAGGTLTVAEPAGGWHATLNGRALAAVPSPAGAWAQAFRLPGGGGTLDIGRHDLGHTLGIVFEALAALVVAVLALPGVRSVAEVQVAVGGPADGDLPVGGAGPVRARPGGREDDEPSDDAAADRVMVGAGGRHGATASGAAASAAVGSGLLAGAAAAGATASGAGMASGSSLVLDDAAPGLTDGPRRGGKGHSRKSARRGRRAGPAEPAVPGPQRRRGSAARGPEHDELSPAGENGQPRPGRRGRNAPDPDGGPSGDAGFGRPEFDAAGPSGPRYDSSAYDSGAYDAYGSPVQGAASYDSAGYDSAGYDSAGYDSAGYQDAGYETGPASRASRDSGSDTAAFRSPAYDNRPGHQDGAGYGGSRYGGAAPGAAGYDGSGYQDGGARGGRGTSHRAGSDRPAAPAPPDQRSAPGTRSPTGAWPDPDDARPSVPSGHSASGSYQPDAADPDVSGPGAYGSGAYGSGASGPGASGPDAYGPDAYGPDAYGPDVYGSGAGRSGADQPGTSGAGRPRPWSSEPGTPASPGRPAQTGPGRAQPDPVRPDPARPDSPRLDAGRQGADRSRPDLPRPDAGWPDTGGPDARPAAGSAEPDWPQQEPTSSWPAHEQPSSWPSQDQPASWPSADEPAGWSAAEQSSWPAAGDPAAWAGADDSLEPLPSGEAQYGAPPPDPAQRSRRRWPAPEAGDPDERNAW